MTKLNKNCTGCREGFICWGLDKQQICPECKHRFKINLRTWKQIHSDLLESLLDKEISKAEYFELDDYMRDVGLELELSEVKELK